MTADLRDCCQQAAIDGLTPQQHFPHCAARLDEPQPDALFDLPDPSAVPAVQEATEDRLQLHRPVGSSSMEATDD